MSPAMSLAALAAQQRCQETLLNCYCREVAAPDGQLSVGPPFGPGDWPLVLQLHFQLHPGHQALQVQLPHSAGRLITAVAQLAPTGNFRYGAPLFHKAPGQPWALVDWEASAALLLHELSLKHGRPANRELLEQIRNSVAVTSTLLQLSPEAEAPADADAAYIESEQALRFGHPFHPAPKSRQGFSDEEMRRYSPELRTRFALHWFAVRREDLVQQSLLETSCDAVVAAAAPPVEPGFVAVPVHPWQAGHLQGLSPIRAALRQGRLRDLGVQGQDWFPTSSMRTLFQPASPYFYKFSLNLRITNCVRKNAWYELESALQVTRLLQPLLPQLQRHFDGFRVLQEPAFLSVDLREADDSANREVVEGFGLILRQGFGGGHSLPGVQPLLAGALFGNHDEGQRRLRQQLETLARREAVAMETLVERWFGAYAAQLLAPVLYCYFAHGLVFEPHLQNVVLGLQDGWPRQIFLRDFEGVKLVRERHAAPEVFPHLSARARESLWYDREQGWNRIAYCLFVNNFCEAIAQLAGDRPRLQQRLWAVLRHQLLAYQGQHGDCDSARRINALLAGAPFPGKANLTNRFFMRPDRSTGYVPVTNPMPTAGAVAAWN